ncbi:MAG: NusG domain II-containing protein [Clostridia bacterium]|nr:NusG domain II-containing protein [Clostridia bacterium]
MPADIFVMLAVVLVAVIIFSFAAGGQSPDVCVIEINGEEFARYDLITLADEKVLEIDNEYGRNTVVIDKHGAAVTYSDCADKIEVKAGKITSSGQSLICLPHRLTVRLEGADNVDGTAW